MLRSCLAPPSAAGEFGRCVGIMLLVLGFKLRCKYLHQLFVFFPSRQLVAASCFKASAPTQQGVAADRLQLRSFLSALSAAAELSVSPLRAMLLKLYAYGMIWK